jgi:hypothetical protein
MRACAKPPAHYNPTPRFGLWTEDDLFAHDMERQRTYELENGDCWCVDCGDPFHLDDCGGYNPPCECGYHCRPCHEAEIREAGYDDDDDYYLDDSESACHA